MKILLAVDDSRSSQAAIDLVTREMSPKHSEICVLHVVERLLPISYSYIVQVADYESAQANRLSEGREFVSRVEHRLSEAGYRVKTEVKVGDARGEILDFAAVWNPDLIVVGSHGREGLDRFLIGSVAETIARHAVCSVLVARR
jgi:nucleotide-binding universal stress UspA family protein